MNKQLGSSTLELLVIMAIVFLMCYLVTHGDSDRESEFITDCTARGGHISKDGVGFLSANPHKGQSRIKYLCLDDKDRILE